jgi:hypothetical protein
MIVTDTTLFAPHSVEECLNILRGSIIADTSFADPQRPRAVLMHARGNDIRLRVHRPRVRNAFAQMLFVRLLEHPNGAILKLRSGTAPAVRIFATVWLAGMLGIPLAAFVIGAIHSDAVVKALPVVLGLPLFGFALLRLGKGMSQGDVEEAVALIKTCLDARETP